LVFQLERVDNPHLYDDLIRFKKGAKRVNRLRTLAQQGLLMDLWLPGTENLMPPAGKDIAFRHDNDAIITNQIFDRPIVE
jgi:hypothetical protein